MNPACSCSQHIWLLFSSGYKASSQITVKLFQCTKKKDKTKPRTDFCILKIHRMKLYCYWHDSISISALVFLSLFVIPTWYLHIQKKNTICHNKKVGFYVYACGKCCTNVMCLRPKEASLKNTCRWKYFCSSCVGWRREEEEQPGALHLLGRTRRGA